MTKLTGTAHAKLNLTLDVVGRRPDGFHDLRMVMQEISLGDELTVCLEDAPGYRVRTDSGEIPADESNLCVKAAMLFFSAAGIPAPGMTIELHKHTPVCAGMGGGSSDGAEMLRLLQAHYGNPLTDEQLYLAAEKTGSDVPFALFGGTALAEGKGERLRRLPDLPTCRIVLCKPPFPVSTPVLFRAMDEEEIRIRPDTAAMIAAIRQGSLQAIADSLYNVFEPVVSREHPEIQAIRTTMRSCGALGACMSGSGPTVFGLFDDAVKAAACAEVLKKAFADTYLVQPAAAQPMIPGGAKR